MTKIVSIESCRNCPYKVWDYDNYACSKMNNEPLSTWQSQELLYKKIPEWCPLPDYPIKKLKEI